MGGLRELLKRYHLSFLLKGHEAAAEGYAFLTDQQKKVVALFLRSAIRNGLALQQEELILALERSRESCIRVVKFTDGTYAVTDGERTYTARIDGPTCGCAIATGNGKFPSRGGDCWHSYLAEIVHWAMPIVLARALEAMGEVAEGLDVVKIIWALDHYLAMEQSRTLELLISHIEAGQPMHAKELLTRVAATHKT